MNVLTVDFETYYDREYSLSKMTMIEYIMDGRFQPIMMSYAINDEPIKNVIGYPKIKEVLDGIDWGNTVLNAQNTAFDATIIRARFGHTARYYTDTMAMARVTAAHVFEGASLGAIAKVLQANGVPVPPKGKEVQSALGMHLYNAYHGTPYLALKATTDPDEVQRGHELLMGYVEYCNNDVHLAREAFKYFTKMITPDEMQYGDMILKCYIEPSLYLDLPIIEEEIQRIHERDEHRARDVANKYFGGNQAELRSVCRSVPKFTEFLRGLGGVLEHEIDDNTDYAFIIPSKYSEKKGRVEPCYSKTFPPIIDMCDRMDEIGDIFRTKLALSSSIELSRAERFRAIAKLGCGFGMPYIVSGAHTHRLGGCFIGDSKIIVQSPDYGMRTINIRDLRNIDLVYDGESFVEHDGLVYKGERKVIHYDGLIGTKDHVVFTEDRKEIELGKAKSEKAKLWTITAKYRFDKYHHRAYLLPSLDKVREKLDGMEFHTYYYKANEFARGRLTETEWNKTLSHYKLDEFRTDKISLGTMPVYDILNCGKHHRYWVDGHIVHNSGGINPQNLSSGRKEGQSNALKRSISAPPGHQVVVFDSSQIELRTGSYIAGDHATLKMFLEGRDPYSEQASLIYGGDPVEIKKLAKSGVEPYASIQRPAGKASLLSNIYGTGAVGFMNYAKLMGVDMTLEEAQHIVKVYRETHPEVVATWNACEVALRSMIAGANGYFGGPDGKLFYYDGARMNHGVRMPGIRLPDGNWLNYHCLSMREREYPDGSTKMNYAYRGLKEGRIQWIFTYAARIFENCNQALAFAVMKYQALLINQRYKIVLNTHDEWGIVVKDDEVEQAKEYMQWCMRQVPEWAKGLPVDCEGDAAVHYGDCK